MLRQADFASGTYRITTSGRYKLENIGFKPNGTTISTFALAGSVSNHWRQGPLNSVSLLQLL